MGEVRPADDPGETADVAGEHPAIVQELAERYGVWFRQVFADWSGKVSKITGCGIR